MDFLVYSRALPPSKLAARTADHEQPLNERHWSYMDSFVDRFTARGPSLGPDRDTWTGSLHIVDLPDVAAVHAFVENEPYQQAGLFARHSVFGFTDLLGRTMWDFARTGDPTFLVLAGDPRDERRAAPVEVLPRHRRDVLVVYGALSTLDGLPAGLALVAAVPSRAALDSLVADPDLGVSDHRWVEVHDWEFGGRLG